MSKFNEATIDRLCDLLERGMNKKDAAAMAAIDESTLYRWERKNASFASRVEASLLRYKEKLIGVMNVAAVKDGRLALKILERRWPNDFGKHQKIEVFDSQKEYKRMMRRIRDLPAE